jgi:hypothetical protein
MKDKDKMKMPTIITWAPKDIDYSKYPYFLKIVDNFVEKFYDNSVSIDPSAFNVACADLDTNATLGQFLTMKIRDYAISKSEKNPKAKEDCANELLSWLTHAQGLNLIREGEATKTKTARLEDQIKKLQDEAEQLRKKIVLTEKENEDLHKALDAFGGRTNVTRN